MHHVDRDHTIWIWLYDYVCSLSVEKKGTLNLHGGKAGTLVLDGILALTFLNAWRNEKDPRPRYYLF